MEFRIFLPVIPVVDRSSQSEFAQVYNSALEQIAQTFGNLATEGSRTDVYIACSNEFGLKFRNEKNLELKVKQPYVGRTPVAAGIEIYQKDKIKKLDDGLDDAKFKSKVKKHLRQLNYAAHASAAVDQMLDNSSGQLDRSCVSVQKSRVNTKIDSFKTVQEYCRLSVHSIGSLRQATSSDSAPTTPTKAAPANSTDSDTNTDTDALGSWISVAYEGDLDYFFTTGLRSDNSGVATGPTRLNNLLWKCLYAALMLGREQGGRLAVPVVVAGYPTWVRYISLKQKQALSHAAAVADAGVSALLEEQEQHLFRLLEGFVGFLGEILPAFPGSICVTASKPA